MPPFFLHLTIQTITFEALLPWFITLKKIDVDKIVQLMPLKLQLKSKTLFKTIPLKCFFLETLQRYAVKVWNYVRQYCIYSDHGELKFGKNKIQMVTPNAAKMLKIPLKEIAQKTGIFGPKPPSHIFQPFLVYFMAFLVHF